jgi:hypothetical protein
MQNRHSTVEDLIVNIKKDEEHLKLLEKKQQEDKEAKENFLRENKQDFETYESLSKNIPIQKKSTHEENEKFRISLLDTISSSVFDSSHLQMVKELSEKWEKFRSSAMSDLSQKEKKHQELKILFEDYFKAYEIQKNESLQEMKEIQSRILDNKENAAHFLFSSIKEKNLASMKLLLDSKVVNINSTNQNGETPLFLAIKNDDMKQVSLLLEKKVNVNGKISCPGLGIITPLIAVVNFTYNNTDMLKLLLDYDADINDQDNAGFTALHVAISRSAVDHACFLLENENINIVLKNKHDHTPLDLLETKKKDVRNYQKMKEAFEKMSYSMQNIRCSR